MSALIEFQDVCKYYQMGNTTVKAADHISFQVEQGEFLAIVGSTGSGKSTCMNIIGCLLGFIFQQYNLLPKLDLLENVEVPMMYAGVPKHERRERARVALELVGLGDKVQAQA